MLVFHSAPWACKVLLGITSTHCGALACARYGPWLAGGYQYYGKRTATGIKPPRLMQAAASAIPGEQILVQVDGISEKVRHVTCHELVHALAGHLQLPLWLHEGLDMVTVDSLAGQSTVRADTQDVLVGSEVGWQGPRTLDAEGLVREYARSYWLARYFAETQPGLLKSLLEKRHSHEELEGQLAEADGLGNDQFWLVQAQAAAHFESSTDLGRTMP